MINNFSFIYINFNNEKLKVFLRGYKLGYNSNSQNKSYKKRFENIVFEKEDTFLIGEIKDYNINLNFAEILGKNNLYNDNETINIKTLIGNSSFGKNILKEYSDIDLYKIEVELGKIYEEKIINLEN